MLKNQSSYFSNKARLSEKKIDRAIDDEYDEHVLQVGKMKEILYDL